MIPENAGYFHAAYVAAAVIYIGYAVSLWRRRSRVRRRLSSLVRGADARESTRQKTG